ncbi:molybdenum cofactor biosysynthesis protein [Kineobactrum sediminis]|uniref:Molybdenum cofactor biosysynthesis protein n=1 Tax=Kineobactrum sediminis TaxID=1905677 RepID=A0A2N5Y7W2_9GAMM|nr:molybdenum cofactor biosysynthesis protein [Kineobactrum sediminis]
MELCGIAIRKRPRADMQPLERCHISPQRGLEGDFRGKPGKRQLTLLSLQSWQQVCAELNQDIPWWIRRANLLVSGVEFGAHDVGKTLCFGDVVVQITRETDPCKRMDEAVSGLRTALEPSWRGGVCCRVITGGDAVIGQRIEWLTR